MRSLAIDITGKHPRNLARHLNRLRQFFLQLRLRIQPNEGGQHGEFRLVHRVVFLFIGDFDVAIDDCLKTFTRPPPAKTDTAKNIRDLKPKKDKEVATEAAKPGAMLEVRFLATDILATEPLVKSWQFKARLNANFPNAMETGDEEALLAMLKLFS